MHIESGPAVYVALVDSGHRTTRLIEEVHAGAPTTGEAETLNICPSGPVLSVQRVNHLAYGRPIEVSVSVRSAERYRLVYELHEDD